MFFTRTSVHIGGIPPPDNVCRSCAKGMGSNMGHGVRNRNILLITVFTLLACCLHSLSLYTPFNQYVFTSALKVVFFVSCPAIYYYAAKDGKLKDLFSIRGNKKSIRAALFFSIGVFVFILAAFLAINPLLDRAMIVGALANVGITRDNYFFALAYYLLANVALEELFFRGFLFSTLYRMDVKRYAHAYSSLLFAVYHIAVMRGGVTPGLLALATVGLVFVGLLLNEIVRRCESVIGSYAVHMSASLAIGLIGAYFLYF